MIVSCSQQSKSQSEGNLSLAKAAMGIIDHTIIYDPAYVRIPYPNGDVDPKRGVCTDVVIRAYRRIGIDLQKEVHEDKKANFFKYPLRWWHKKSDASIDHRRVLNLMTFFARHGEVLEITNTPSDYKIGNIVCWDLGGGTLHIGIVVEDEALVHNIGSGQIMETCLFNWKIIGHYAYPKNEKTNNK